MLNPVVTVVIPVYNGERHLRIALDSVVNQTYKNLEIFVVDNASEDTTVEICESYTDPRLSLIRITENIGIVPVFNRCLLLGTGKYLKLLCHDDSLDLECIRRQVDVFELFTPSRISLVTCQKRLVDVEGRSLNVRIGFRGISGREFRVISGRKVIRRTCFMGRNVIGESSSVLIDRKSLGDKKFSDHVATMELELWVELLKVGDCGVVGLPLVNYRIWGSSISTRIASSQYLEFRRFIRATRDDPDANILLFHKIFGLVSAWVVVKARVLFTKYAIRRTSKDSSRN